MNIVVCIKQIIDPEINPEQFKLDPDTKRQVRGGLSLVISAYDQNALEVALQLKEKVGGKITALCLGAPQAQGRGRSPSRRSKRSPRFSRVPWEPPARPRTRAGCPSRGRSARPERP